MKIGELAKLTDCQVETIRYYGREGLLPEPARSEGNYRLYTQAHTERLTSLAVLVNSPFDAEKTKALASFAEHFNQMAARIEGLIANQRERLCHGQRREGDHSRNIADGAGNRAYPPQVRLARFEHIEVAVIRLADEGQRAEHQHCAEEHRLVCWQRAVQRLYEGIADRIRGIAGEAEEYTFEHANPEDEPVRT